jgi:hypothetical protein
VTWSWHESADARPPTAPELAELRRRLTDANRALADDSADLGSSEGGAQSLDAQVRRNLQEMITGLAAKSDPALGGHVCRTPTGLMLHSWSASTPPVPDYPDSRQGGISGTVWLDGQTAAGVKVVLQNKQGADVDHTTTGRTGAFGFQNVAPGHYRVRVTGRGDFPAEGLAVTVGREAVEGLELRGGSSDPAVAKSSTSAGAPSGSKRRWLAGLAGLALLGAGALVWRTANKPAASATADGKTPFAWQSASGKLAEPVAQAPADEARKAGGAGSWSELSRNLAPPQTVKTTRPREAKASSPDDRPPAPSAAASAEPSLRASGEKSAPKDSTDKNNLFRPDAKPPRGADPAGPVTTEPTELNTSPADETARDEPDEASARSPENKTSDLAAALPAKKRPTVPGSSLSSVDSPSAEAPLSSGVLQTRAESFSAIPKGGSPSARAARVTKPNGSGTADQSSVSAAAAESGLPAEASSGSSGAESTDHVQNRPGAGSRERTGLARATATTQALATGEESKNNEAPPTPDAGHDDAPPKSPARTNQPAVRPVETPPRSTQKSLPGDRAATQAEPTPDTPAPGEGPAKPATTAGSAARAAAAPVPAPVNPAKPGEAPAAAPHETSPGNDANPAARPARPVRNHPSTPAAGSQAVTESETPANGLVPASVRATDDARAAGRWVSLGRVSTSAWQSRLVRDLVLPTQPVPEGEDDALEAMQANSLKERKAQMPPTFQQPVTTSGLAFEFSSDETGASRPLRWRDAAGAGIAGSMVQGNRAELAWAGANAPRGTDIVLADAAGQEIVRVSLDQTGSPKITARPGVRTWYWVGIEHAPADASALRPGPAEPRLTWRFLAGTADVSTWPQDNHWRAGRGQRIDLPLGPTGVSPGRHALALVDPVTGWAIACDITLR